MTLSQYLYGKAHVVCTVYYHEARVLVFLVVLDIHVVLHVETCNDFAYVCEYTSTCVSVAGVNELYQCVHMRAIDMRVPC
jgi:hypothetical protein